MRFGHLAGRKVLVVEDEFTIADMFSELLREQGVEVIGPAPTVGSSVDLIAAAPHIDAAVVDVNLRGIESFGVADALQARGVPFAFMTGYEDDVIPARFADVPIFQKPTNPLRILANLLP